MPGSGEKTSCGCFSAVLSRLLCSGGLPTHPSERLIEPGIEKSERRKASGSEEGSRRSSNPGVVARLMGLESFPAENRRERTLGDYFRSKSVNSIDFLSHFDPAKPRDRRHRRVKTSVSFRDGLSDEFASVVLLLEEEFQAKMEAEEGMREKQGKVFSEVNDGEIEEKRRSIYAKNVEIKVKIRKPVRGNSALSKTKTKTKPKKKKNLEGKRRTELKEERRPLMKAGELKKKRNTINLAHKLNRDFNKTHPQPHATSPERGRIESPRKHQPSQAANSQPQSSCSNASFSDEILIIEERDEARNKISENICYKKMVEKICLVTEESVRESWILGMELKFEKFEEICQLLGEEILQLLISQFVDEISSTLN